MSRRLLGTLSLLVALALLTVQADDAFAARRVALIIGNAKYEHAGVLANTLNDAHAIASLLKQAKFDVVEEHDDLSVVAMKRVVRDFAATARNADISVIYYSGHGIEAAGVNYLIPVDARLANAFDVEDETVQLDRLLWATSNVKALSLVILDACRENPFLRSGDGAPVTRGIGGHVIGQQATTTNTLIAYAAKAGSLSYDGTDQNSPFTTALVKFIAEPGIDIRIALGRVRDDVLTATGNRQEPFVYGSLGGETVSLTPTAAHGSSPITAIAADYAMAERIGAPEAWRAFIQTHREGGFYVDLARAQLNRVSPAPPATNSAPIQSVVEPKSPAKTSAPPPSEENPCKTEGARLAMLRNDPSSTAIADLAAGMKCAALRSQLNRLMESVGLAAPAPALAMTESAARNPAPAGCEGESRELEHLRAEPDAARAKDLFDRLTCPTLRPQLRRVMESLGVEPAPAATSPQFVRAPQAAPDSGNEKAADICVQETSALTSLRANPDRKSTIAFANAMRCDALKAQVTRLLESLSD